MHFSPADECFFFFLFSKGTYKIKEFTYYLLYSFYLSDKSHFYPLRIHTLKSNTW